MAPIVNATYGRIAGRESLAAVLEEFGYNYGEEAISDLAGELRQLPASIGMFGMVTGALMAANDMASDVTLDASSPTCF